MSRVCHICLGEVAADTSYHPRCLRELFGSTKVPHLDIEVSKLHTAALAMVGHTSLSGIQKKISVGLAADRETLQVVAEGGRYILKPANRRVEYRVRIVGKRGMQRHALFLRARSRRPVFDSESGDGR